MSLTASVVDPTLLALGGGLVWRWTSAERRARDLNGEVSRLRDQASDTVTGGPTRAAWESVACARLAAPESTVVLIADLDRFKPINDQYGHLAGDTVLQTMSERLHTFFAESDGDVCRLGGDEFGIIATDSSPVDYLTELTANLTAPVTLPTGEHVSVGVSLGCFRVDHDNTPSLRHALEVADKRMRDTKLQRHDPTYR